MLGGADANKNPEKPGKTRKTRKNPEKLGNPPENPNNKTYQTVFLELPVLGGADANKKPATPPRKPKKSIYTKIQTVFLELPVLGGADAAPAGYVKYVSRELGRAEALLKVRGVEGQ